MNKIEEKRYYTPNNEEFHVGFEYEILHEGKWEKTFVTKHTIGNDLVITIKNGSKYSKEESRRVKFLDKEDIESCGFIFNEEKSEISSYNSYKKENIYLNHINNSYCSIYIFLNKNGGIEDITIDNAFYWKSVIFI